ncbi:MAG: GH3 auxin-responsive promoter family protein [Bacteroides sp.]|nr:GH3 auxin-responsive promoter family protein [Bacteroides sp.]
MAFDLTPLIRPSFIRRFSRTRAWADEGERIQTRLLRDLVIEGSSTHIGKVHGFDFLTEGVRDDDPSDRALRNLYQEFRNRIPPTEYEDIRPLVMRMINGEADLLWPGVCRDFAQSSGTSGGRSKYIPVTRDSLRHNHYAGSADCVASYLNLNPNSRMFSGKGFILGGSFATQLEVKDPKVRIGDLSATLISRIPFGAGLFRIPDKKTALMPDWESKLPALAKSAARANVTNISGVPSWFLTVIQRICEIRGTETISEVWPNLEVFFHGGISFAPYRDIYRTLTNPEKMHFLETYNASEGFFAVQDDFSDPGMLLLIDNGIFYEFLPLTGGNPLPMWEVSEGEVYELVITSCNGLWRYRLGDTVRIESLSPLKITIAGRTRSFINAFGEELMEDNAEKGIAEACARTGARIRNYTAAPRYAEGNRRGRHQWAIEWEQRPESVDEFAVILDGALRRLNSDYDAKRSHTIFLDPPQIISVPPGTFDRWLHSVGTHKLGGQRKVPRLSNDRHIIEQLLELR